MAVPLALLALIPLCWVGLASALAGARTAAYPAPRAAIQIASASAHPHIGDPIHFSAQALAGTGLSYVWDFGDGTQADGARADHGYQQPGDYQVTLFATDAIGQRGQTTRSVAIYPPAPNASFHWSGGAANPFEADFFADGPTFTDSLLSWRFGDGATGTGLNPTYVYARPGTYTVTLTVTDSFGQSARSAQRVTVPTSLPFAYFTTRPLASTPRGFNFDASLSQGAGLTYTWSFGDGTNAVVGGVTQQYVYAQPGSYVVTLVVTDRSGRTDSYTSMVSVS